MDAVGVGHNEHPSSHVWSAHGARRYNRPLRVIPDSGQVSENRSHPSIKQRCDVLHDDVSGSKFANEAREGRPQTGSFSPNSSASTSMADVLAWESTAYDIARDAAEGSDISMDRDCWPVPPEDGLAVLIVLDELDCSHAGSLESKTEGADTAEEVEDIHAGLTRMTISVTPASRKARAQGSQA
jgi:hypothetical protein